MSLNQHEVDRAVARATGESISTIQQLGFLLSDPDDGDTDSKSEIFNVEVIDWDALALLQQSANPEWA